MKIEVVQRFVHRGAVRYPGEVLEVSSETGEELVERGVAKPTKPPKRKEKE